METNHFGKMSRRKACAIFDCQGFPIGNAFLIKEMSFMALNSEIPTTLYLQLPCAYSNLSRHDRKCVKHSKNMYHGLGFANMPDDCKFSIAITKLKEFFRAACESQSDATMGYPRGNYHAKNILDNSGIPCISLDAVGIPKHLEKLGYLPEDFIPCCRHATVMLRPFRCTQLTTYLLAQHMKCSIEKNIYFSPRVQVHVMDEETLKDPGKLQRETA